MIKRYKEIPISETKVLGGVLNYDPQGEWVKYEDVKPYIENRVILDGRDYQPDNIFPFKTQVLEKDYKKCDCARMMALMKTTAEEGFTINYIVKDNKDMEVANKYEGWWICPVHGYKKR